MKKIFTLIACVFAALAAQAQITVTEENGTEVKNGGTVTFQAAEEQLGPDFVIVACEPQGPIIKNTSGKTQLLTVKVTRTAESNLTWCGISMSCLPMTGITESRSVTLKDGEFRGLALHANFDSGQYATYEANVECTLGSDKFNFTVKFVYSEDSGIHGTTGSDAIALQGKDLRYRLNGEAATINVFSADGRRVESERVSGEGTLSLGKLGRGVYVYEVLGKAGRIRSGKVFVR